MEKIRDYEFWFVAGSQFLYGEEQLKNVARDAQAVADKLNESGKLPYKVVCKGVMTTADGITQFMKDVNYHDEVAGVITWMHTFSPAKNWIRGTVLLQKPLLHLATQYLDRIPYDTIDFDYMNLNQSAHGDREYGYLNARLGLKNKIVYGWWGDEEVQQEIADWEDVAVAYNESATSPSRRATRYRRRSSSAGPSTTGPSATSWPSLTPSRRKPSTRSTPSSRKRTS